MSLNSLLYVNGSVSNPVKEVERFVFIRSHFQNENDSFLFVFAIIETILTKTTPGQRQLSG